MCGFSAVSKQQNTHTQTHARPPTHTLSPNTNKTPNANQTPTKPTKRQSQKNSADLLDPALMRPGRFDRKVRMPKPDTGGRYEILRLQLRDKKVRALVCDR
jgi:ATP-dependent 26S proteasome regulatory subunit